jgi:hypothetical protein
VDTSNTFSSGFTIANIFFTTANHVEMILRQTPRQSSFAICAGLFAYNSHELHRALSRDDARRFPEQLWATSRAV